MNYKLEIEKRVEWIKKLLLDTGTKGIVYGNSGGKDSTLVGLLAKQATDNLTGIIMPCESKRNYSIDREHALLIAEKYNINTIEVDLTEPKISFTNLLEPFIKDYVSMAYKNINPRLRMITLYAYAQSFGYLVAGTGNLSEATMGYFTKWGDGACDFNPIADFTVTEIFAMLEYMRCPREIIDKAPSAGLYDGQTDEIEMGITYNAIDEYLRNGGTKDNEKIEKAKMASEHKRNMPITYKS